MCSCGMPAELLRRLALPVWVNRAVSPQTSMNHRNYDLVPVSSDTVRDIYAEAFGISGSKVQALGVPRTDLLFDWDYEEKKREGTLREISYIKGEQGNLVCTDIPRRWE